ncbi:hypothetical protein HX776_17030 [Pseudomonas agarici]|uniref:hypothetical protein n=1 Tax=Pseudomonas agarici TaxID=46677 RepID=UPI00036BC921|nr:hypothetical protein [Pseudomonas agarici]NWC10513.1 hypothetical protein [Pseudomonas agarici]SEL40114.1 hypothetical protein SAMN05216604_11744 [Pseudomonas agarici]
MSPKIPIKPKSPPIRRPELQPSGLPASATPSTSRLPQPDGLQPQHLDGPAVASDQPHASYPRPTTATPTDQHLPATVVADPPGTAIPLETYRITTGEALPPPNKQGLRITKKRRYVDLEDGGTVMVVYDAQLDTYRAKRSDELLPSGPALYRIGTSTTWGLMPMASRVDLPTASQPPLKRPRQAESPADGTEAKPAAEASHIPMAPGVIVAKFSYFTPSPYTPLFGPDSQGYYRLKNLEAYKQPGVADSVFAFSRDDSHWVLVEPPEGRMDLAGQPIPPEQLPTWTDREIWALYGLHGNEINRFRSEAEAIGRPPRWAHANQEGSARDQLIQALKWAYPDKSAEERGQILRRYNLLPSMLPRLKQALLENGKTPEWAEAHKLQSMAETNPHRFDLLEQEVLPHIRPIRNFEPYSLDRDFDAYYTRPFLEAFLLKIGYRKNIHGCLYRTDIPAMFRSEDRTPFELARDGCMLAREGHPPGSTTKKALSATFSLSDAQGYGVGGGPGIGQLRYNTQTNKYPGKRPTSDTGSDSATGSSDTSQSTASTAASQKSDAASTVSSSGTPISLDSERGYTTLRHRQTTRFIYMIDTRNVEVVPGQENYFFNYEAENVFFPYDDIEGHISVSRRGINADRIWLVNSSLTRAAKVQAIRDAAGEFAASIESATWEGVDNGHVYDQLIDQVADSGEAVLNWPTDKKIFSDDVIWPSVTR